MTIAGAERRQVASDPDWRLTFRVWHPDADLTVLADRIADLFGVEPLHVVRAGMHLTTPTGRTLDVLAEASRCAIEWIGTGERVEQALHDAAEALSPLFTELGEIVRSGGKLEFFAGLFVATSIPVTMSPGLMAQLAASGIEVQFDIYGRGRGRTGPEAG